MTREEKIRNRISRLIKSFGVENNISVDDFYSILEMGENSYNDAVNNGLIDKTNIFHTTLFLNYIVNEIKFVTLQNKDLVIKEDDENYLHIANMALDKYISNEYLNYSSPEKTEKNSFYISPIYTFANLAQVLLKRIESGIETNSIIINTLTKCFDLMKVTLNLAIDGYNSEAFASWRTLHECESILALLYKYGPNVCPAYRKHMTYAKVFRANDQTNEINNKIFANLKEELKMHDLKSKDLKKYIEYGWIFSIPGVEKDQKLNFRDGVEKLAGLEKYSKVYELASELAHSSPLLIYADQTYFGYLTLLNVYETFFRIVKVLTSFFEAVLQKPMLDQYRTMFQNYYPQIYKIHSLLKESFAKRYNKNN